ncbi:hypothetical protein GCK72_011983 [Caenorhabditis remanei]|uniref:K Homology domain-containing protein n=1 Tax=Caenorhabditis remanei TaxID=31234 RepID=A0A6A5GLI2_CAERE|nr:hypothetical protein GCK72_011983 [Caenorhabditis remanei]KAF1755533.1 hypothetical protein GCK72_011983 [Caenorhabditis remanei]
MTPANVDSNAKKKEIKKDRPDSQRRRQMRRRQEKEEIKKPTPPSSLLQNPAGGPANKKAHIGQEEEDGDILSIKLLIPPSTVRDISDDSMRNLMKEKNCRTEIMASKTNPECFPLLSLQISIGRLNNIMAVIESIQEKIRKKCADQVGKDAFDVENTPRRNEIKVLIPNTSSRMYVGTFGTALKMIRKDFGAKVQMNPKDGSVEAKTALERVVTVAHEESPILLKSVSRVIRKVAKSQNAQSSEEDAPEEETEPIHCMLTEKGCFNLLKEEYMRTGEVVGCPTPVPEHRTAIDVTKWAIDYEELLLQDPPRTGGEDRGRSFKKNNAIEKEGSSDARIDWQRERVRARIERRIAIKTKRARDAQEVAEQAEGMRELFGSDLD